MTILVTGSTGTIGSRVVDNLHAQGASIKALVRKTGQRAWPSGVGEIGGDLSDLDSMKTALEGVDTLFLLNAVTPDELTQATLTLDLAIELGIERIVYFSVLNSALFTDVPHFSAKNLIERIIDDRGLPVTTLRAAYFFQNDYAYVKRIGETGVYPAPIGSAGVAMVDAGDIAEIAANELLRRERTPFPLPRTTIDIFGPDALTGEVIAKIWSDALGVKVRYSGDDLTSFENTLRNFAPAWQARDFRLMLRAVHKHGMLGSESAAAVLAGLLGREPRRYADFAQEQVRALKFEA